MALAAACGGSGDAADLGPPPATVATIGDSVTAGFPGWEPDPAKRARLPSPTPRSQYQYWAKRRRPELTLRNCGVSGELTYEIAARLRRCVRGADAVIIQGGANNLLAALRNEIDRDPRSAVGAIAFDVNRMVEMARSEGVRPYIADLAPIDGRAPVIGRLVERANGALRRLSRLADVPLLPFNATLRDPQRPSRFAPALTADGLHPSVAGHRRLGRMVARRLPPAP